MKYELTYDFHGQKIEKSFNDLFSFFQELNRAMDSPHIIDHTIEFKTNKDD